MSSKTDSQVITWLEDEYAHPFAGWDFSYLNNRRKPLGSLPWQYPKIAGTHLANATSVLDIDTGGGEVFAQLLDQSVYKGRAHATESHRPNVVLANNRLDRHQVQVYDTSQHAATFDAASFELVLSRHGGSITPGEIYRILAPAGKLVTEQIEDQTNSELREVFGANHQLVNAWPNNASSANKTFSDLGFEVLKLESHSYPMRFMDVGAIVYYLKALPWEVPDFSVLKYQETLLKLHQAVKRQGFALDTTYKAYIAVLVKQ